MKPLSEQGLTTALAAAIVAVVLVGAGGVVYYSYQSNKAVEKSIVTLPTTTKPAQPARPTTPVQPTQPAEPSMKKEMTVTLKEQNDSGENGTAVLTDVDGKVQVKITVSNEPRTASQPAHIHLGACPTPGAVKYTLSNVVGGSSTTVIDASMDDLLASLPLAINLHKSTAELSTYMACGDLSATLTTTNKGSIGLTASEEAKFASELAALKDLDASLGLNFSEAAQSSMMWKTSSTNTESVATMQIQATALTNAQLKLVKDYFTSHGFKADTMNSGSTMASYKKGTTVCTVEFPATLSAASANVLATGMVTISCGTMK